MGFNEVKLQFLAAAIVALQASGYGLIGGWSSSNNELLQKEGMPLPFKPLTKEEISWLTALLPLGTLIGCFPFGLIGNKFGRKWPIICLTIPITVSWLIILFPRSVYYLYAARLLQGIVTGGVFTLCQLFFIEIASDSVRGSLSASTVTAGHIGVVLAFALAEYGGYHGLPIFSIALSVLSATLIFWLPETPLYLVKQGKFTEAEKSVRFYNNFRARGEVDKLVKAEVEKIKMEINKAEQSKKHEHLSWSDFKKNPGRKAMIIGAGLGALNHITGSYALIMYTKTIFEASGSIMSSGDSSLIVAFIQLIGTFIVPLLIEHTGRKVLYGVSTVGSIIGFGVLGVYMMYKDWGYEVQELKWIPIVSYSGTVLVQSLGVSTLGYTVTAEVMPEKIKEFGISFSNVIVGLSSFIVLKFLPSLSVTIGFHGTMYLFGAISIPAALFVIFYVPETKGRSYEQIQYLLR